jgi:hypothetical protein
MDVRKFGLEIGKPLPYNSRVFRIVLSDQRDKHDKSIPSISCFSLSPEDKEDGFRLSVDCDCGNTPELTIARVGSAYKKGTTTYKDYKKREIYALDVDFLTTLDAVNAVIYDPIYYFETIKGKVDNPAHSLITFNQEQFDKIEAEVYLKLRNHAKDKKQIINMTEVDKLVEDFKK